VRAQIAPILERRLGPALAEALAKQAGRPGASTEGILQNLETTGGFEISRELTGLQLAAGQGAQGFPDGPSVFEGAAEGAIGGAVVGGPVGALAGGVTGGLSASFGKSAVRKETKKAEQRSVVAEREASAEAFGGRLEEFEPETREQALVSGKGAQRAQALEAAITAGGFRDTGIGTLGSIAAGVQVPLEEISRNFEFALADTRRAVAAHIGAGVPGQKQKPDRLAQSLEALANFFLTKGSGDGDSALPPLLPGDAPVTSEEVTEPGLF